MFSTLERAVEAVLVPFKALFENQFVLVISIKQGKKITFEFLFVFAHGGETAPLLSCPLLWRRSVPPSNAKCSLLLGAPGTGFSALLCSSVRRFLSLAVQSCNVILFLLQPLSSCHSAGKLPAPAGGLQTCPTKLHLLPN